MHLLVGLGNPGSDYAGTRHNLGFEVIDVLADRLKVRLQREDESLLGLGEYQGKSLGLMKPLTYMNNSGWAVADAVERFQVPLTNLLVICDDFQLPLGVLRLRGKGSDGGHNGLYSIIYHLNSEAFPRLRMGIATETMPQEKSKKADFVLGMFEERERPLVKTMVDRSSDAALSFVTKGLGVTMNLYNKPAA
ncbi:MAG TPA: aminoacyl-tRNA hydrolase [Bacteroidota bacterium]|nr:aminoacyl-tRNA hydrolase [Bacteroidota bacterium]